MKIELSEKRLLLFTIELLTMYTNKFGYKVQLGKVLTDLGTILEEIEEDERSE